MLSYLLETLAGRFCGPLPFFFTCHQAPSITDPQASDFYSTVAAFTVGDDVSDESSKVVL
jgi:hypothetical protein